MRLREAYLLLVQAFNAIGRDNAFKINVNYSQEELTQIRDSINRLNEISIFKDNLENLYQTNFYLVTSGKISFGEQEIGKINANLTEIRRKSITLIKFLEDYISSTNYSFSIQLSPLINDFGMLEEVSKKFKMGLSLTVNHFGGHVQFVNYDIGSWWIDLITSSKEFLELIGTLISGALNLLRIKQEHARSKKNINTLDIDQKQKIDLDKAFDKKYDDLVKKEAEIIIDKFIENKTTQTNPDGSSTETITKEELTVKFMNAESINIVEKSIKELIELLQQGNQITPKLNPKTQDKVVTEEVEIPDTRKLTAGFLKELPETTNKDNNNQNLD